MLTEAAQIDCVGAFTPGTKCEYKYIHDLHRHVHEFMQSIINNMHVVRAFLKHRLRIPANART